MSTEANKAVVVTAIEALNRGDIEACVIQTAPVCPLNGQPFGREGDRQRVIETLAAFPDGQYTMHEILADGDKVVLRWSFSGTQRGEFMGIPPTGRRGTMTGISIFGFKDGLISEFWEYYDSYDFLQQLGAVPALG